MRNANEKHVYRGGKNARHDGEGDIVFVEFIFSSELVVEFCELDVNIFEVFLGKNIVNCSGFRKNAIGVRGHLLPRWNGYEDGFIGEDGRIAVVGN